jgi:hypothetical protein
MKTDSFFANIQNAYLSQRSISKMAAALATYKKEMEATIVELRAEIEIMKSDIDSLKNSKPATKTIDASGSESDSEKLTPLQKKEQKLAKIRAELSDFEEKLAAGKSRVKPDNIDAKRKKYHDEIEKLEKQIEGEKETPKPAKGGGKKAAAKPEKNIGRMTKPFVDRLKKAFADAGVEIDDTHAKAFAEYANALDKDAYGAKEPGEHMVDFVASLSEETVEEVEETEEVEEVDVNHVSVDELKKLDKALHEEKPGVYKHNKNNKIYTGPLEDEDEEMNEVTMSDDATE